MHPARICLFLLSATMIGALLAGPVSTASAWEDLPDGITVTQGDHEHAQLAVRVDVPAPATDRAVTSVQLVWQEEPATGGTRFHQRRSIATPGCVSHQPCTVQTVLPTARMLGTTPQLTVFVYSDAHTMGLFFHRLDVDNPKPTVRLTSPQHDEQVWGPLTLAADAAPSPRADAAPLKGVRFYLNPMHRADDAFLFDATAPYQVHTAIEQGPLGRQEVYAVAEDIDGNLSPVTQPDPDPAVMRRIRVGPPPLVAWETPLPGRAAGDVTGISLGWHAALPDPFNDGPPGPHITQVDVLLDGQEWSSTHYQDTYSPWNTDHEQLSEARYTHSFTPGPQLAPGAHTATVQVHTSYGVRADATVAFTVANGLTITEPRVGGQRLTGWRVVTAGQRLVFTALAASRAGTALLSSDVKVDGRSVAIGDPVCPDDPVTCPDSALLRGVWTAPLTPGEHQIVFTAHTDGQDDGDALIRNIVVQAAGRLTAWAADERVRRGSRLRLSGRLTRTDTRAGVAGWPVAVQARATRRHPWRRIELVQSGPRGHVRASVRARATRWYRFTSPEDRGNVSAATSRPVRVRVGQ